MRCPGCHKLTTKASSPGLRKHQVCILGVRRQFRGLTFNLSPEDPDVLKRLFRCVSSPCVSNPLQVRRISVTFGRVIGTSESCVCEKKKTAGRRGKLSRVPFWDVKKMPWRLLQERRFADFLPVVTALVGPVNR